MKTLGAELSIDLFPAATWSAYDAPREESGPYPGRRPTGSWRLTPHGRLNGVDPVGDRWCDRDSRAAVDLSGRRLVLAYGSNPGSAKLLEKLDFSGDDVIALRAAVFGWAAVWCDARRDADDSVVATLLPVAGRVEVHPVLALTPNQMREMDSWEGHPRWYRRDAFSDRVLLESGEWRSDVEVYLGTEERRPALVADGLPLLCSEVSYARVDGLVAR